MSYLIDLRNPPFACLPDNLDTTDFVDITTSKDMWKVFYDPSTGKKHNCNDYYNESIKQK